jgi:hypothetical protein
MYSSTFQEVTIHQQIIRHGRLVRSNARRVVVGIDVRKETQTGILYYITLLAIVVLSSFAGAAQNSAKRDDAEFDLVDVADFNPPLLDESMPAMFGQYSELCGFCA